MDDFILPETIQVTPETEEELRKCRIDLTQRTHEVAHETLIFIKSLSSPIPAPNHYNIQFHFHILLVPKY
jgi:hypothetical protein